MATVAENLLLLLARIVVGIAFFASSRNKFRDMREFSTKNAVPLPAAYFVATAEMLGAIGVVLGILAPIAAAGVMLLMLATISLHILKWHSPYWASSGGWEYDLMLFTLAGTILVFGAGAVSVDELVFR
ncbi:DoxX family protein [Nocardia sp. AG03]|uniref:DoxX family protein n=1 Tax=Nocardia sp. AG03 TaxID=3025312 RepID=UPI0024184154|nr:DoxX family protein [Nocardia sp. AG03]